jgi:hypothetical protein
VTPRSREQLKAFDERLRVRARREAACLAGDEATVRECEAILRLAELPREDRAMIQKNTKAECLLMESDRAVAYQHAALLRAVGQLESTLAGVHQALVACGVEAGVNELGKVQSLGGNVDRYCALFVAARRHAQGMRRLHQATEADE